MTKSERLKIIQRHLTALGEHFDAVQIVACRQLPDGSTENYHLGRGCWYSRYGLVKEHSLRCEREMMVLLAIGQAGADDPPEAPAENEP